MTTKTPDYRLIVNGENITPALDGRLISLTLTDERSDKADQLDITLSDHDGRLAIPPRNAKIQCWIGWQGNLVDKGEFILDEISLSGPPDILTLRARSADFKGSLKRKREESWHQVTLGDLLTTIAKRGGLIPATNDDLAEKLIEHIDQNESDLNFLARLGEQYGAVATVKAGRLLFLPAGTGKTNSGTTIPSFPIYRQDGDQYSYSQTDRDHEYSGVQTRWNDTATGEQKTVTAGSDENPRVMRHPYPNQADATQAAQAEWRKLKRAGSQLSLTLAEGNANLYPETPVTTTGFKSDIDATPWITERVTHQLSDSGFLTDLQLEVMET